MFGKVTLRMERSFLTTAQPSHQQVRHAARESRENNMEGRNQITPSHTARHSNTATRLLGRMGMVGRLPLTQGSSLGSGSKR